MTTTATMPGQLQNHGNMCHLNAAFCLLAAHSDFRRSLIDTSGAPPGGLQAALRQHLDRFLAGRQTDLSDVLPHLSGWLTGGQQQDASESMYAIAAAVARERGAGTDQTLLGDVRIRTRTHCGRCPYMTTQESKNEVLYLMLPSAGTCTLMGCLNDMEQPVALGDWRCDSCGMASEAAREDDIDAVHGDSIVMVLQRTCLQGCQRLNTQVGIPPAIRFKKSSGEGKFTLAAVIHHSGCGDGGHYVCCLRHPDTGDTYTCNDDHVRRTDGIELFDGRSAYILLYERAGA